MKLRAVFGELFAHASIAGIIAGTVMAHNPSPVETQDVLTEPEPYAVETVDADTLDTSSDAFVQVTGKGKALAGLVDACKRGEIECVKSKEPAKAVVYDEKFFQAISASTAMVNEVRGMASDEEVHGKSEYWTSGYESQDCEDDKIEKRDYFHSRYGVPYEAMSFVHVDTEVIEELNKRESHLLLMVRTTQGDYFSDNRDDKVYRADELFPMDGSGYVLHRMSSFEDVRKWFDLADTRDNMPAAEADPIADLIEKTKAFTTKASFTHKPPKFEP